MYRNLGFFIATYRFKRCINSIDFSDYLEFV